jgi:hypothetical protein
MFPVCSKSFPSVQHHSSLFPFWPTAPCFMLVSLAFVSQHTLMVWLLWLSNSILSCNHRIKKHYCSSHARLVDMQTFSGAQDWVCQDGLIIIMTGNRVSWRLAGQFKLYFDSMHTNSINIVFSPHYNQVVTHWSEAAVHLVLPMLKAWEGCAEVRTELHDMQEPTSFLAPRKLSTLLLFMLSIEES